MAGVIIILIMYNIDKKLTTSFSLVWVFGSRRQHRKKNKKQQQTTTTIHNSQIRISFD